MIVANNLRQAGAGFGTDTNVVTLITKEGAEELPQMTKEEAFAESKRMMQGQKWNAFVLDLSFIGWDILSGMTMGILGIFYVQPYKDGTHAALYEALRYRTPYQQIQDPAPYQQNAAMDQQTTTDGLQNLDRR